MRRRRTPLAGLLCLAVLGGCSVDTYEVSYASVFEARAHEADTRGWLPEWLPEGATDIRQRHDGRESDTILRATLPPDASLDAFCTPGASSPPAVPLAADWFTPAGTPSDALACDDRWYAVIDGSGLFMWRSGGK